MLGIAIQTKELNEILKLLNQVLNIRITFFDADMEELPLPGIKEMSPYCRKRRRRREFDWRCRQCDRREIEFARPGNECHIYRCHSGLWEGVVPLHDPHQRYLGAIVFGQLRPARVRAPQLPAQLRKLYGKLPIATDSEMAKIASLLKYLGGYIISHELIHRQTLGWADFLGHYIDDHLEERLALPQLARLIGKSTSFLNHSFKTHFGLPVAQYIRKRKMERAVHLLKEERYLYEIAGQLGFYDEFHFSRSFKAFYGLAPRDFKKK
jgi:AraC-like DNA-binding protein